MGASEGPADALLLAILVASGAALGSQLGSAWFGVSLALALFLFICARRMRALLDWLSRGPRAAIPPELPGVTGDAVRFVMAGREASAREFEAQEKRHALLRESLSALRDGIVILDADHRIEWSNAGARRLLGQIGRAHV